MLELNANGAPYAALLLAMTLLVGPYLRHARDTGSRNVLERKIGARHIGLAACYLVYVVIAVWRKIDINYGGVDALSYLTDFQTAQGYDFWTYMTGVTSYEPIYSAVSWIIGAVFGDYKAALFFWHTLAFFALVRFMRESIGGRRNTFLVIAAFFLLLLTMFNTLRMTVAIAIALNALTYASDGKWVKAALVVLFASCVHVSAAIMLPVLAIVAAMENNGGYSGLKLAAVILMVGVLSVGGIGLFATLLSLFGKDVYIGTSGVSYGVYLSALFITFLGFANRSRLFSSDAMGRVLLAALPVCLVCIPLQLSFAIVYRMAMYFVPLTYAISPMLWDSYRSEKPNFTHASVFALLNAYCVYRLVEFFTMDNLGILTLSF